MKKKFLTFFTLLIIASLSWTSLYALRTNKKLKILFTTTYFPAFDGRFILNLIKGCIDAGHDVAIFAKYMGPKTTHELVSLYKLKKRTYYGAIPSNFHEYDIIFSQFGYRGQDFAPLLQNLPNKKKPKLVTCFRGADITKFIKNNPHRYDELFRVGTLFLPVCEYFKNLLIRLHCNPNKIVVLHSAIDCNAFSFKPPKLLPKETYKILSVSRLVEKKGIQFTIQAMSSILKKHPNVHYTIVGDGIMRAELERLVRKLNLQKNITFKGRLQEKEIIKLLHSSHVFVLPSITAKDGDQEGIPNALKEAMSCGLPVIATNHAGNSELVIPNSGFLVNEQDPEAIADKVCYLIEHQEEWRQMGVIGRKHVLENFEMNVINQKLITLFESLSF